MRHAAIAALGAVLLAASAKGAQPIPDPVSGAWTVAAFKQLCADPFGNHTKVVEAVGKFTPAFEAVAQDSHAPMPGSTSWRSPNAVFGYTDGNLLPRPLPSPQCTLTVRAAADYDHAATTAALASALGLPAATPKGDNGRFQSEWNFKGPAGEKRRLFLSQAPGPDGPVIRVSLLNLR